jgi:hypothetical protein
MELLVLSAALRERAPTLRSSLVDKARVHTPRGRHAAQYGWAASRDALTVVVEHDVLALHSMARDQQIPMRSTEAFSGPLALLPATVASQGSLELEAGHATVPPRAPRLGG